MGSAQLPQGTLTFLLTDLVASTRTWESSPARMRQAMAQHDEIVAKCLEQFRGTDAGRWGDSVLAVFRGAGDAAACALALQREFAAQTWPTEIGLRPRMAIHTGEAELREGRYYGLALNRCARLLATCHGGQVLITRATEQLLADELPARAALWDLGHHALKDLTRPERVFQLVDLDHPTEFPPIRSLPRQLTNLPVQLTPFIGREQQLRELVEMRRQTRLLTLIGPGGAGKTRLAIELASQLVGEESDGVWLVELDPLSDPQLVPQAVATGLGVTEQPGRQITETLVSHARGRRLLLVLDNCEHLVEPTAKLAADLLTCCDGVSVLATSREPLKVPGELTWRVPPLSRNDALHLFADRAKLHEPAFQLNDDTIDVVGQICERLDFIPLAIELAAARVGSMPIEEILRHLESRFALLTGGDRTVSARLRTLRAAMDWSHDLLGDAEKILFRRLAIFAGRFPLSAVESVCTDETVAAASALELLPRLVEKSLVTAEHGSYRLLETIRTYGRERLTDSGEQDALHTRLGAYVLSLAEARPPGQLAAWLDQLEVVHDDIRNTLRWSVGADPDLGIRLAVALTIFWQLRGNASEPRQYVAELLEHVPEDLASRDAGLLVVGTFAYLQGDISAARRYLAMALDQARTMNDQLTLVQALEVIGLVGTASGELTAADAALEEALTLAREHRLTSEEAVILHQLALLAGRRQDLEQSRRLFDQSIALRRAQGRADEASMSLTYAAGVALLQGEFAVARRYVQESLELGLAMRDRRAAFSLDVLACLTAACGDHNRALLLAGAGAAMHEGSGNTPPQIWADLMSVFLQPAREALGDMTAGEAWDMGHRLDYDEAMQLALATRN